ncbi:hypothetical protein ABZX92_00185 [Lentzea sp. NPDC006480]|uniref:hypothetical protein n=1 Tax=Lentzea sp. NPDC006480 TaxID=3157176 RepID=UPI0033BAE4D6
MTVRAGLKRAGVVAASVALGVVALTAPASADTTAGEQKLIECLDIGLTSRSGNTIHGYGSIKSICSGTATISIQWSRWFGWENVRSETVSGSGHDHHIYWNCSGSGTHDFRTIIAGTIAGNYQSKISNVIANQSC